MSKSLPLVLASASPRRKQLLCQLGYQFTQLSADIDEQPKPGEPACDLVERLAREKALAGAHLCERESLVLGSDTIVVLEDRVLGKPKDKADCVATLRALSGREHRVLTAVAVTNGNQIQSLVVTTKVRFCGLTDEDIAQYWATGEPADKAGSYGIQGLGGNFVEAINGSYSAVVGLPLVETRQLIASAMEWGQ
ncbi:Maf family protein [Paraferrimonas sedimenticola]|uniref:dTTP/UTP pyrophosphatase n=1 Tax=Paraferrimonas sedimenticola TaxID=375674 RepID=A0AA37RXP2_9GAMM|nr:Maf family protein [Paraferrimonas sedimenticola]GLP97369.1 Maf-like protein [Paraferrimonas sedimenticola]